MNTWALAELVPRRLIPFSVNIWGLLSEPEWVNVNTYVEVMYTMLCFFVGSSLGSPILKHLQVCLSLVTCCGTSMDGCRKIVER